MNAVRVVVVDAFERGNRGDAALLAVLLEQVREVHPGADVRIAGFEDPRRWPEFDGVPNLGSIRRYAGEEDASRWARVSRKLLGFLVAALATVPPGRFALRLLAPLLPAEVRSELRAVTGADLVVALGGGYLNARDDLPSDLSVFFLLLPLWLAQRHGVPVVAAPQSYGPFPRRFQRLLVRAVLSRAREVVVREDISRDRLLEAGVDGTRISRGVDSGFAFSGSSHRAWRAELGIPAGIPYVVVTARQWLPGEAQERYEQALAAAMRHLLGSGRHVVLAPQVTCEFQADDDRIVGTRIAVAEPGLHVITHADFDHHDAHALYAGAEFVLGTRFHSVIFALTAGVPCLAIEYDHKTRGIMRDLGLEEWVRRIDEVSGDDLIALLDRLESTSDGYRAQLADRLPAYVAKAADTRFLEIREPSRAG